MYLLKLTGLDCTLYTLFFFYNYIHFSTQGDVLVLLVYCMGVGCSLQLAMVSDVQSRHCCDAAWIPYGVFWPNWRLATRND